MEYKWPSHLTSVDVPINRPAFNCAGVSSDLLELISAEIISSCDPRLSADVPNTSVYASLAHGKQNVSLLQRGSGRKDVASDDRSMEGLGEELREMAKNLKVRVHINPKFLPILADRAAIAGGNASMASLLQGRMGGDLDQVQSSNHENALSAQKLWQGNDPGKDRKSDAVGDKEAPKKRIQPVSKLLLRRESETEGRTSVNSDSKPSGPAGRVSEGQLGNDSEGKGNLNRVKVDPENRLSAFNQDSLTRSELRYEMERDENEQLIAEVVSGASSSVVPSGPTLTDSQKAAMTHRAEQFLPQGDLSPEFLVSIKQERHSGQEDSSDESSVTGKSRGTAPVDGKGVARVASDLTGVEQGQGLESEGIGKGGVMRDSSAYLRKQDKQKLKEEVLLLEKMVAEKKALQVERENRERNGGRLACKEKLQQQRTVTTEDREMRKSQQKSATGTTERLQRTLLVEEKQKATPTDRLRERGIDDAPRLAPEDRPMGSLGERQTSTVSHTPSGGNKLRSDTTYDAQETTRTSDERVRPAVFLPCAVEEKPKKPMTSDHKEIALKPDIQERRKLEDQSHRREITTAHESVLKEIPKKKEGWPERQQMPALFPAFQNSNILQSKDKVPAVNNDFDQSLRNAEASQEHSRLAHPKAGTPKFSKESETYKSEEQKRVFQSPKNNAEVREAGNTSLARTPADVNDPAACTCGFKQGKKMTGELCEFCLRRQLLGNIEGSSSARFASPESVLPSASLQQEVVSVNSMQGEPVGDVDGVPPAKNSSDDESLDAVDNAPVHLPCLCPETQFESQFYDCASVRRIHLEATREWMHQKPLEMLICGRLKELPRLLPWSPADIADDPLIMNCLTGFSESMVEILEELTSPEEVTVSDDEVPCAATESAEPAEPPCATEQLANSLFEEVRQHLEFLSEKSLLQNVKDIEQMSDRAEDDVYVDGVTPRVRGPEVLQTIPVLKKPSRYSAPINTCVEVKATHCDVSLSETLPSHITLHSSPPQVTRDDDNGSCHEQLSFTEEADASQTQSPTKDVVRESKIRESSLARDHTPSFRIPPSPGNERLRERSGADVRRSGRSHEMEHGYRRGVARGRDSLMRRRGFDSERNFYQNRGRELVEGPGGEYVRLTDSQYRTKPPGHDSRRKHSRSQGDDRNEPRVSTGPEPKRFRKERGKEPGRVLEGGEMNALENTGSPEKKLGTTEPSSEVKDLKKGAKKAKKNRKEKHDGGGSSSRKAKEKKEKRKAKKKKKTEAEKVSDQLLLEKPADTKVALSHLLSDAADSAFAQANTDSGSAFARLNDDLGEDPTSVETQAALNFQNMFKCPSDVETPQVDISLGSPPLMQCFLDKNIDYSDVMHKLADVIPGTGNFDAKRLTPQTSFVWALALAVFKDDTKAGEAIRGSARAKQEFKQNLFNDDFVDAYEVGEGKEGAALESYQSVDGEATDDKASGQKLPGGRGSNLMQAFRQVVEAKRRAQELSKTKLGLSKLSPELAAKRAAPKAAKTLFMPPTTLDAMVLLSNTGSGRFVTKPAVHQSTDKHLAENLAREAFIKVYSELELLLEEYCGLNNLERTAPPPLKFYLMYTHFAPLSLIAISLYKSVAAVDVRELGADQRISSDVDCTNESPLGSALNSLKRKRTDADFMVCALLKKPREQTYSMLNKSDEEVILANMTAKDVALGGNNPIVPTSRKLKTNEGSTPKEKSYPGAQDFYLNEYLPASDSLTDDSQSPPNAGNNFVSGADNGGDSVVASTNAELPSLTAVTDSRHQRFLNAKGPRFMQTFRQNQIAKRRTQKENLRTATGGKLLHNKQTLTVGVAKPKPIGMTLEETLAVLSGHHSPVSSPSVTATPSTSGTSLLSTDVNATLSRDVNAEVVPTNVSPLPQVSCEDSLPIKTVTTSRSPTVNPLQDLNAIPLPPSALQDDSCDAMDIGSPSESSITVELGVSFALSPVTVPYVTQPISASTSFGSSFLTSSSSDCYSGYEVSCAPPSGHHLTSYLLPTPPAQMDDTQMEDAAAAAETNIQPPYSVSSAADTTGQMMNSDWQYEYFPPPVDLPPPVSYPSMSAEQPVQQSGMMPPHFASPRPYLLETPPDIHPGPYPCMPNDMPPHYPHPCPDQRVWDNNPHPPPQPFPPPHPPPQGLPWRGGRPPPPMNMMIPPNGSRPRFRPPPPGMNPNSPIMGPRRPLLLRPPSSSSVRGGLLPHPGSMPLPFGAGFRERSSSDPGLDGNGQQPQPMTSATDTRMYIFNKDKAICKSIQRFLEFLGATAFDPYNIETLHTGTDDVCTVLIHEGDIGIIHRIPNLLRLKRDSRVTFSGYYDVMDVKLKKLIPLFPSAGLIVFDNAALLSCKSEYLQMLCEFVHSEGKERKSWAVVVSPQITNILVECLGHENLDSETNARLVENKRLVAHFTTLGVIQQMTDFCHPLSSLDYQKKCIALQSIRCRKYRHFIFITDFPKSHPDSSLFLDCGIDMMNIAEFLGAFVGKSVDQPEQKTSGEEAHITRLTSDAFADGRLSSAVDSCVAV